MSKPEPTPEINSIIHQVEEFLRLCADRQAGREIHSDSDSLQKWNARNISCEKDNPTDVLGRLLLQLPVGTTFTIRG